MKKLLIGFSLLALSATASANDFFGGNNGEWKMGPNGPYYEESDWPEWTPLYWMQEMADSFDDNGNDNFMGGMPFGNNNNNNGFMGGMPFGNNSNNNGFMGGMPFMGNNNNYPMMPYGGAPMGYGAPMMAPQMGYGAPMMAPMPAPMMQPQAMPIPMPAMPTAPGATPGPTAN